MTREEVFKGLECCAEYECGKCPYKYLDSFQYPTKCIHTLIVDLQKLKEEEENDR